MEPSSIRITSKFLNVDLSTLVKVSSSECVRLKAGMKIVKSNASFFSKLVNFYDFLRIGLCFKGIETDRLHDNSQ